MTEDQGDRVSAIYTFLKRISLSKYAEEFRQRGIDRVVGLRQLSDEELRTIVPDENDRATITSALTTQRGKLKDHQPAGDHADYLSRHQDANSSVLPNGYHHGQDDGRDRNGKGGYRTGGINKGGKKPNYDKPCRLFFSDKGCPFQSKCRYRHDNASTPSGFPPSCEPVLEHELVLKECDAHSTEITVPSQRIKFLIGQRGSKLKAINDKYGVRNDPISISQSTEGTTSFHIYGKSAESVEAAKNEIAAAVGFLNEDKKKERFLCVVNELDRNTHAARLLCVCNKLNEGTPRHLSEKILRNVISTFRFLPRQKIKHYYINTGAADKDKLDRVSKLVAQLKGVQAIIFCEATRVRDMNKGAYRISRCMNNVAPVFVHPAMPKEERMRELEKFKNGTPNENGIRQRLLVTTVDYAKLAQKFEIPFVNFVIHFALPKSQEFYALQSNVVGRNGTVGASILCVCSSKSSEHLTDLQKEIDFDGLDSDESFSSTALELTYDTEAAPLTSEDAYPTKE